MTKNQKLLITLGCAVVSHLAVGALGYSLGDRDGWRDGVRDGHIAVRAAVRKQTDAVCVEKVIGRECDTAIRIQQGVDDTFPNAGKVYRDPIDSVTAYMTPPN